MRVGNDSADGRSMTMSRMPGRLALPVFLVLTALGAESTLIAADRPAHVRVVDAALAGLIDTGLANSETFRTIVSNLESAPVLVFVRCRTRQQQATSAAGLEFLSNTPTYRYVRVFIRCDLPATVQAPLLAHEFQHALEVADAPGIVDGATL